MNRIVGLVLSFLIVFLIHSCKKVVHREVNCRGFAFTDEPYWFPTIVGDTIKFVNAVSDTMKFVARDMYINHRTKYISDTGCGCADESSILLTSNTDSLWFRTSLKYIEDQAGTRFEDIVFILGGVQSTFYENQRTPLESYAIDALSFTDVRRYNHDYSDVHNVKQIYLVRNLGIVSFELVSGEVWTNADLLSYVVVNQGMYSYSQNLCQ